MGDLIKEKVYITGHRVPDTDSICSALAYAELKNRIGDMEAIPVRLGELNQETRFVLDYFKVKAPVYMDSIKPLLKDIEIDRAHGVSGSTSLSKASEIIENNHLNSLAVVDNDEKLEGIVSLSNITKTYANIWDDTIIGRSNTPLTNITEVLSAKVVVKPDKPRPFDGSFNIYAMHHLDNQLIKENDIVLVGDRFDAQKDAIERGVSLLVLTNNTQMSEELCDLAHEMGVTVISSSLTTFIAARMIPQAVPISFLMTKNDIVGFYEEQSLEVVQKKMAETRFRSYPVLNANNEVIGSISRFHLINVRKKKLIQVDHNEASQSIPDIDHAEIIEIIDHHRVANVTTSQPIYFRNMPVGCTSTIISQMFFEQGIRPSKEAAGLMSAAIISDTLLFRSPTSTAMDKLALERLAPIAGIDPETFAMEMFRVGTDLTGKKPTELLTQDVKFYTIADVKVKVAQVFTMNLGEIDDLISRLITRMKELLASQEEDTYVLAITDLFKETSQILVVGRGEEEIALEFGQVLRDHSFMADGVLSRKKQLIPVINQAISKLVQKVG